MKSALTLTFLRFFPFSIVKVTGVSMKPALRPGTFVFTSPLPYWFGTPRAHDIILFTYQKSVFIKRIERVDDDRFYVLGDNKHHSTDSRTFGWIQKTDVVAKVIFA